MDVTQKQIDKWQNGELIQKVFPHLSISQREFLLTGAWDNEWDEAFPPCPKEVATPEVGIRLEHISQDIKDKMTTIVFRSILRVADLGTTDD